MSNRNDIKYSLLLFLGAGIWGFAFVAQQVGMEHVGPFTLNAARNLLAALAIFPMLFIRRKEIKAELSTKIGKTNALKAILSVGITLFIASNFQQVGLAYTTVGKAGFITTLYIVIVPIIWFIFGRKVGAKIWITVALATLGLYFLSITNSFEIQIGDFYILCCAFIYALQILAIERYAQRVDIFLLAFGEFMITGILSSVIAIIFENPTFEGISNGWISIAYAGILSSGIAYTIQIKAQKHLDSTIASLIMSLESIISVLAGMLILNQNLTQRELLGAALVFIAVLLAQLPQKSDKIGVKVDTL